MSGFLERLLRQRGGGLTPLEKLAQKAGNELYEHGLDKASTFPTRVRTAIRKSGLPKNADGYVFWLLMEEARYWPPMPPDRKEALQWLTTLMEKANATPMLDGDFELPNAESEALVEGIIEASAQWALSDFRMSMFRQYNLLLDKYKGEAAKLTQESTSAARGTLSATMLVSIKRKPRWFKDADFLYWSLRNLIP